MAHTYSGHREMHVGHRRAKTLMRSGGYAVGGRTASKAKEEAATAACPEPDEDDMPMTGGEMKQGGRLDKRARGGKVEKFANGGGAFHKITPSKRKPHMSVNIVNISRGGGGGRRRAPLGGLPLPGPAIPAGPAPIPMPAPALKPPGFAKGGSIGKMRKGKKYGQGSGEGRLEEFNHMKGR